MERNNANIITSKQAMLFIMSIQLGIGITNISSIVVRKVKHDGWITILLGGVFVAFLTFLISILCKHFNGASIIEINKKIFGKYIGFIINLVLIIYLLFVTAINIRFMIITIASWFFQRTPLWALTVFIMIPSVYLAYYGLKGICRYNIVTYTVILLLSFLILSDLNKIRFTLLLPVGSAGMRTILLGIPETGFAFMGFETLMFIYPFIKDKQKAAKYTSAATLISAVIYTAVTAACIGVFGEEMIAHRIMPIVGLVRMVRFPIFERIDLYFLAAWIPGMMVCVNSYLFCIFNSCEKVFGIRSGTKPSIPMLIVLSLIVILLAGIFDDINTVYKIAQYAGYVTLSIGLLIPAIWLPIAFIFRRGGKQA